MDRTGECRASGNDVSSKERDHELRASLFGIEAVALALDEQRDRLSSGDVDQLARAIASEARRLRLMLDARETRRSAFDLAEAIRPAILMTRSSGAVVHDEVPAGMWVYGCRDDVAEAVFALLDNARVHAAPSAVSVRATALNGTTTLFVEDRGPGIARIDGDPRFIRRPVDRQRSGGGLGLAIARRLMVEQAGSLTVGRRPGGGTSIAMTIPSSRPRSTVRRRTRRLRPTIVR